MWSAPRVRVAAAGTRSPSPARAARPAPWAPRRACRSTRPTRQPARPSPTAPPACPRACRSVPRPAGTSPVTVTARDTTGASGSASFTWTVISSGGGGAACTVTYPTASQWAGGFVASVSIANGGTSPISGWTLKFTFPGDQKITNAWNSTATQSGETVSITNASYNATIAAGGSTSVGFQGTWTTSDAVPTSFAVNGTTCAT